MWLHPDPDQALRLAVRCCAIGQLIGLVELFAARRELEPGGFLDWSMIGILSPRTRTRLGSLIRRRFRRLPARAFRHLAVADAIVATWLLVRPASPALIAAALILQVAILKRHHLTMDGSDQMTFVVLLACWLGRVGGTAVTIQAAVWFLAAELTISYLTAGVYKATSPYWRSGSGFAMLVQTRMYGQPVASRAVRRYPGLGHAAAYSVVLWESLFVVALTAPPRVVMAVLVVGLGFHLGCGMIMGLNRFVWAFVAGYPAFLCANLALRSALGAHTADAATIAAAVSGGAALAVALGWQAAATRFGRLLRPVGTPSAAAPSAQ